LGNGRYPVIKCPGLRFFPPDIFKDVTMTKTNGLLIGLTAISAITTVAYFIHDHLKKSEALPKHDPFFDLGQLHQVPGISSEMGKSNPGTVPADELGLSYPISNTMATRSSINNLGYSTSVATGIGKSPVITAGMGKSPVVSAGTGKGPVKAGSGKGFDGGYNFNGLVFPFSAY
jgi:hypothetical protein